MINHFSRPIQVEGKKIELSVSEHINNSPLTIIRTCKRSGSTLQKTIDSMLNVGFKNPIILEDTDLRGSFWSLKESIKIALKDYTGWVLLCEDDVIFCQSSYRMLNEILISTSQTISLFCTGLQDEFLEGDGWNSVTGELDGSLAYFVHTDTLKKIINTKTFREWSLRDRADKVYVDSCKEISVQVITHRPSLVQHIGEVSAINPHRILDFRRMSLNYKEDY